MPSYRCPKGERFKNCKRYLGLVFAITLSYSLYFQKRKIVFLFIFVYFLYFSIFKIIIHFYFMKYDIYAPKYLFNNPSNPLPCLASSLHISCTVSCIASYPNSFALVASSFLPIHAPCSASALNIKFFFVSE